MAASVVASVRFNISTFGGGGGIIVGGGLGVESRAPFNFFMIPVERPPKTLPPRKQLPPIRLSGYPAIIPDRTGVGKEKRDIRKPTFLG
jgi:hypothetical protein